MRKAKPKKRIILPDPKFTDVQVTRFVNNLMYSGKKSVAYGVFYEAMAIVQTRLKDTEKTPLDVWKKALENITPMVEVKSRRVGGANFQVPVEVRPSRRSALSMRWIRDAARKRGEKSMGARLANELLEAAEGRGGAVKKREEVHRMAEANKAFSHFRF